MELVVKEFSSLTLEELYKIIRAREEIFIVEQNCVYLDVDGIDQQATHVFLEEDGELLAYCRLYWEESRESSVKVGRVIAPRRSCGFGLKILQAGISVAVERYDPKELYLHAQEYAIGFYEKAGFSVVSPTFLEDGIPHVEMVCLLK